MSLTGITRIHARNGLKPRVRSGRRSVRRLGRGGCHEPDCPVCAVAEGLRRRGAAAAERHRTSRNPVSRSIPVHHLHVVTVHDDGAVLAESDDHGGLGTRCRSYASATMLQATMTFSPRRRASSMSASLSAPGLIHTSSTCFWANSGRSPMPTSGGT